jgi:hypothetical protein
MPSLISTDSIRSSITLFDDERSLLSESKNYDDDYNSFSVMAKPEQSERKLFVDTIESIDIRPDSAELKTNDLHAVVRYSSSAESHTIYSGRSPDSSISRTSHKLQMPISKPTFQDRLVKIPGQLTRYGVRKHKVVRTLRNASESSKHREVIIHEDYIFEWTPHYLGVGFRLQVRKQCGNLAPSLSTYPIISEFDGPMWDLMLGGSIEDVQSAFATRKLHPFVQDTHGQNLYHVSSLLSICSRGER